VIAVARQGDQSIAQVARSFGVSESCLARWLKIADREDGVSGAASSAGAAGAGGDLEAENQALRKRAKQLRAGERDPAPRDGVLRPRRAPKMMYPLVQELAADKIPVVVTCRVLGFSKQAFYKWQAEPVSQRDWDDAHLINAAIDIHHDDPEFGYRFITDELADQGITASRNRVNRLCSSQRLWSVHARKRGLNRKPGPPVHDDLVLRDFTAEQPNQLWLTDITEDPTAEGKLYLCAVKDACSRRIVGYSIGARMTADLAVNALANALALRGSVDTIVHSDRGSQPAPTPTSEPCGTRSCAAPWVGSVPARTTPPWSPSSACCRRTSSTGSAGPPASSCAWRSSSGSRRPTTAADAKTLSAA
jgi:hypothetical protein